MNIIEAEIENLDNLKHEVIKQDLNENGIYKSQTTIISMFFTFDYTKHTSKEYNKWAINMLMSVNVPLVIFTDYKTKEFIMEYRYTKPTIYYVYESIWQLMRELEINRNKTKLYYINKYVYEQKYMDPEKNSHSPNLYAVWNLKAFLCDRIATINPFNSKFFMYSDMGAWRDGIIPNWPNETFVRQVQDKLNDRVLFSQIGKIEEKEYTPKTDIIEGGFFGGTPNALANFKTHFYNLHDDWLRKNYFIGKDQTMMNILTFETHKSMIARLNAFEFNCNMDFKNEWFFYQIYFGSKYFYKCKHDKMNLLLF